MCINLFSAQKDSDPYITYAGCLSLLNAQLHAVQLKRKSLFTHLSAIISRTMNRVRHCIWYTNVISKRSLCFYLLSMMW